MFRGTVEEPMMRRLMTVAVSAATLTFSAASFAQPSQFGTAQEARTMLDKAVAAVKADEAKALDMFNKGEGGSRTATSIHSASISATAYSLPP